MKQEYVFMAIKTERDYQDKMTANPERPDMIDDLHIGDTLAAITYNLNKAHDAWYKGSVPHLDTLEYLRNIAALCVKAGETYGMPARVG